MCSLSVILRPALFVAETLDPIVEQFRDAYRDVPITYVHQREQLELDHSVLQARHAVNGTFLLVNEDNVFVDGVIPAVEAVRAEGVDGVLGVDEVSREAARTTGVIETEARCISGIVEKPDDPPSQLVTTGCYHAPRGDVPRMCARPALRRGMVPAERGGRVIVPCGVRV